MNVAALFFELTFCSVDPSDAWLSLPFHCAFGIGVGHFDFRFPFRTVTSPGSNMSTVTLLNLSCGTREFDHRFFQRLVIG